MMVAGVTTGGNIRMRDVDIETADKTRQSRTTEREIIVPSQPSQDSLTVTESEENILPRQGEMVDLEAGMESTYDKKTSHV